MPILRHLQDITVIIFQNMEWQSKENISRFHSMEGNSSDLNTRTTDNSVKYCHVRETLRLFEMFEISCDIAVCSNSSQSSIKVVEDTLLLVLISNFSVNVVELKL